MTFSQSSANIDRGRLERVVLVVARWFGVALGSNGPITGDNEATDCQNPTYERGWQPIGALLREAVSG
jgi:hypothetical protein